MGIEYYLLNVLVEKLDVYIGEIIQFGGIEVFGKYNKGIKDFVQASGIFIFKQGVVYIVDIYKIMNV